MPRPLSFVPSVNARLVRQRLAAAAVGEVVTWQALAEAAGKPIADLRYAVEAARRSLTRDAGMVFGVIRAVGLKRLADGEIVDAASADVAGIRRRARRAAVRVTAVQDYAALSPGQQVAHTVALATFTAVGEVTSDRGQKRIAAAAHGRAGELPIAETLAALTRRPE